ncbi:purine-cytosine permease family protein [Amycolatopsis sp. NPDC051903]|uniref:purine-cytosine permease family protein n=1 Tax=Amycolatopsis sp. NPDC051903 TaxID=3363936 RepID=UPI0037BBCC0E
MDPGHAADATAGPAEAGRIETRGIEHVPEGERHGKPRELFWIWLAANVTYLYFVLGGVVLMLGLNLWQAILVVVAGNLYWLGVGALAVPGPASGTPSAVVSRAMFGVRGNRPLSAGIGWLTAICYEAINLALGAVAGFALADHLGLTVSVPIKGAILIGTAVFTFAISIYGHATIVKVSPWFTAVLSLFMVVLAVFVVAHTDPGYAPPPEQAGTNTLATVTIGVAVIAAVPLSWANGADYSRYLPRRVSKFRVLAFTALGGFVPAVVLGVLGVLAGTSIDMTDPQTTLASIVPGWFYPMVLLVIWLSSVSNNVLTAYSSGLCLQSVGVPVSRAGAVFIAAVLSVAMAAYALFVDNFIDSLSRLLEVTVVVLAPSMALFVADILLRRNRYDGLALNDERPASPFWYRGGFNVAGISAFAAGIAISALCVNTAAYQGPLSRALGGSDLTFLAGPAVTAFVYCLLWPRGTRRVRPAAPAVAKEHDHA